MTIFIATVLIIERFQFLVLKLTSIFFFCCLLIGTISQRETGLVSSFDNFFAEAFL